MATFPADEEIDPYTAAIQDVTPQTLMDAIASLFSPFSSGGSDPVFDPNVDSTWNSADSGNQDWTNPVIDDRGDWTDPTAPSGSNGDWTDSPMAPVDPALMQNFMDFLRSESDWLDPTAPAGNASTSDRQEAPSQSQQTPSYVPNAANTGSIVKTIIGPNGERTPSVNIVTDKNETLGDFYSRLSGAPGTSMDTPIIPAPKKDTTPITLTEVTPSQKLLANNVLVTMDQIKAAKTDTERLDLYSKYRTQVAGEETRMVQAAVMQAEAHFGVKALEQQLAQAQTAVAGMNYALPPGNYDPKALAQRDKNRQFAQSQTNVIQNEIMKAKTQARQDYKVYLEGNAAYQALKVQTAIMDKAMTRFEGSEEIIRRHGVMKELNKQDKLEDQAAIFKDPNKAQLAVYAESALKGKSVEEIGAWANSKSPSKAQKVVIDNPIESLAPRAVATNDPVIKRAAIAAEADKSGRSLVEVTAQFNKMQENYQDPKKLKEIIGRIYGKESPEGKAKIETMMGANALKDKEALANRNKEALRLVFVDQALATQATFMKDVSNWGVADVEIKKAIQQVKETVNGSKPDMMAVLKAYVGNDSAEVKKTKVTTFIEAMRNAGDKRAQSLVAPLDLELLAGQIRMASVVTTTRWDAVKQTGESILNMPNPLVAAPLGIINYEAQWIKEFFNAPVGGKQ